MSKFTRILDWATRNGEGYIVKKPLVWEIGHQGSNIFFEVPEGTYFDFTSHWSYRWIFNPHNPKYLKAAALHDHALKSGWHRVSAAGLFSEALLASKVSKLERFAMVLGVVVLKFK